MPETTEGQPVAEAEASVAQPEDAELFAPMSSAGDQLDAPGAGSEPEIWRPVHHEEFASLYEVSNLGRVRSLHRDDAHLMTPRFNKDGYPMVCMYANGRRKTDSMHRLVCWAFHGPPSIRHGEAALLDGNRRNVRASNLKWVGRDEITSKKRNHGTLQVGERHALALLRESEVTKILEGLAMGITAQKLADEFCVSRHAIEDIRTGKNWRHVQRPPRLIERLSTGNGQNGADNHNAGVTWEEAAEIRRRAASGEHVVTLGREFGLSKAATYKLVAGKTYLKTGYSATSPGPTLSSAEP